MENFLNRLDSHLNLNTALVSQKKENNICYCIKCTVFNEEKIAFCISISNVIIFIY